MQLKLTSEDLHIAVTDYIRKNVTVDESKEISVDFKAGRSGNGTTATVNITQKTQNQPVLDEQIDLEEVIEASTGEAGEEDANEVESASQDDTLVTEKVDEVPTSTTEPTSIFGNK